MVVCLRNRSTFLRGRSISIEKDYKKADFPEGINRVVVNVLMDNLLVWMFFSMDIDALRAKLQSKNWLFISNRRETQSFTSKILFRWSKFHYGKENILWLPNYFSLPERQVQ